MPEPVHFFLHVPKCAGTTVEAHFSRTLGDAFMIAPRWRNPLRDVIGNRYPSLSPARLAHVRLVSGHSLSRSLAAKFPGRPVRASVLLRDPVSFLLSFYNYRWARHRERGEPEPPDFAVWRRTQRRNPISRFLLHRHFEIGYPAVYRLSSRDRFVFLETAFSAFHFVGAWTRCDEAVAGISRELGVDPEVRRENVGAEPVLRAADLPEAERGAILEEHALDALLFERWRDRGFRPGPPAGVEATEAAALRLDAGDALHYLPADIESALRRKLWR